MQETQAVQEQRGAIGSAFMRLGRKFVWGMDRYFGKNSKVGDHAFFDVSAFPWVPGIEADWKKVRTELDALLPYAAHMPNFQDLSKEQKNLSQDDGWKTFFFYAYGIKAAGNCKRCPETVKLLKKIPGMKTAFFSILAPGKHLPPHRGPVQGGASPPSRTSYSRAHRPVRHSRRHRDAALGGREGDDLRRHLRTRGVEPHRQASRRTFRRYAPTLSVSRPASSIRA